MNYKYSDPKFAVTPTTSIRLCATFRFPVLCCADDGDEHVSWNILVADIHVRQPNAIRMKWRRRRRRSGSRNGINNGAQFNLIRNLLLLQCRARGTSRREEKTQRNTNRLSGGSERAEKRERQRARETCGELHTNSLILNNSHAKPRTVAQNVPSAQLHEIDFDLAYKLNEMHIHSSSSTRQTHARTHTHARLSGIDDGSK